MAETKIKLKDLMGELDVPSKDLLRGLREAGIAAKSIAGSVTQEEAARLREHFTDRKDDSLERVEVRPNVIVRRRKKDALAEDERAVVHAEATAPAPEAEPVPEQKKEVSVVEDTAPAAIDETPTAPVQTQGRRARAPRPAPMAARVISRPQPAPAPVAKDPSVPEVPVKAEVPSVAVATDTVEKAMEKVVDKEVDKEVAPIVVEQQAASEPAVESSPAEAAPLASPSSDNAEKTKASRATRPDASAMPAGSSAPTLPPRSSERPDAAEQPQAAAKPAQTAKIIAPATPQVRIISRPSTPSTQESRPARTQGRPGGRDNAGGSGRPGGGPRPGGFNRSGAGFGQQPPQPADSRDGQSKKKRLKGRRTVDFQQGDMRHEDDDATRMNRGKARRKGGKPVATPQVTQPLKAAKRKIRVTEAIRVADMAHQMGLKANEIIKVLFGLGVMATINQSLDIDTATLVAAEFGYEVEKAGFSEDDYLIPKEADAPESLKPRPPVVTIMGHVDHGKTSLLDAIRKSNVTSGEAGGITQHIGAYHVRTKRGEIVFLDTPGHEAFTAMRARGAQVTDLVILVVAADDGVMEQTREAINHSRAAGVPIMVAVNKMDKPGADPDRVLRELAELGLQPEDWGGDTIVARVSAKTRQGLDDLLEMVALQSEIMELKANPDKAARGHIVEAKLDKGRGPIATVLIQEGTLRQGDNFVCGPFSGRVRALMNDQGKKVKEAGPSLPMEVQGFDGVPEAGEEFFVVADEKLARRIADSRAAKQRERDLASESRVTLETFLSQRASDQEALTLNLVLKADVQGTLEAITEALHKQSTEKVRLNVVHGGAGAITESDILLASASKAIIIGFNVRPTAKIKDVAEHENVDIRFYDIIYKLVDDIKSAMAGLLAPVQREVYLGQAEVRETFSVPKVGVIAGSYVADGKIVRNAGARLLRDGVVVYTGKISSLKRFKDDAREVVKGNECGVGLENFNDVKVGDIIETFETVEEAATL